MDKFIKTNVVFWADTERIDLINKILQQEDVLIEQENFIQQQVERIKELESRLNRNSQNSNMPPSMDIFDKPKRTNTREKTGRKTGGQPGHIGITLQAVEKPDLIENHDVVECEHCKHDLSKITADKILKRQVADVPQIRAIITEHHIASKTCPSCKKVTAAPEAKKFTQAIQYGDSVKALATYLGSAQLLPLARTVEVFKDVVGIEISQGTLVNIQEEMAAKITPSTDNIKEQLTEAEIVDYDETGMRVGGEKNWVHNASNDKLTSYDVHEKRGTEAMDEINILPRAKGIKVTDELAAYNKYEGLRALCNGHLDRELKGMIETYENQPWLKDMRKLMLRIKRTVDRYKKNGKKELSERLLKKFSRQYDHVLMRAELQVPIPEQPKKKKRGKLKQHPAKNLYDRLLKRKANRLLFMYNFKVPFTNNQAERDLRIIKLRVKISGGYRSRDGAKQGLKTRSYISTCRKQNVNVMDSLRRAAAGKPDIFTTQPNTGDG